METRIKNERTKRAKSLKWVSLTKTAGTKGVVGGPKKSNDNKVGGSGYRTTFQRSRGSESLPKKRKKVMVEKLLPRNNQLPDRQGSKGITFRGKGKQPTKKD